MDGTVSIGKNALEPRVSAPSSSTAAAAADMRYSSSPTSSSTTTTIKTTSVCHAEAIAAEQGAEAYNDSTPVASTGLQSASTESAGSAATLRGTTPGSVTTPSYPFPRMLSIEGRITPDVRSAHEPFTSLSPTVTPSPAKMAKSRIQQDFRESGYVSSGRPKNRKGDQIHIGGQKFGTEAVVRPNVIEIATSVQSELGLAGWWGQLTEVLRDFYGAERATLSVATDATDVENVPWAQLATYYASDEGHSSRVINNGGQSPRSNLLDTQPRSAFSQSDKGTEKLLTGNLRNVAFADSGSQPVSVRPRLESRHSYAGYPSKQKNIGRDGLTALSELDLETPRSDELEKSTTGGWGMSREDGNRELRAELLHRYNIEEQLRGGFDDDAPHLGKIHSGNILQPVQPLESETDPLITTAGVLRVLRREHATILTREYRNKVLSDQKYPLGGTSIPYFPADVATSAAISSTNSSSQQTTFEKSISTTKDRSHMNLVSLPSPKTSRSHRSSKETSGNTSSRSNNGSSRRKHSGGSKSSLSGGPVAELIAKPKPPDSPKIVYEDFEQFPGTPWAQSPAPSPAPQIDPSNNPFFSSLPDQGAFDEHPPEHEYGDPFGIPAIGLDSSQSIIQLPLIHPSRGVSQPKGSYLARSDENSRYPNTKAEPLSLRRTPIAIVSILAPTVPYPPDLMESLNEFASLLATSFYAARTYTHMLLELSALSRRRPNTNSRLDIRDGRLQSSAAASIGLAFADQSSDKNISPVSPSSTASVSTHSNLHSPKGSLGSGSVVATPNWESHEKAAQHAIGRSRKNSKNSPAAESNDTHNDYFLSNLRQQSRGLVGSPKPSQRPGLLPSNSKRNVLHSQGASFANTQPSLPTSTSAYAMEESDALVVPQDVVHVFKEPSSSVLRTMIDNGATQQFIAESETGILVWANSKFLAYRNASKENIHEQLWKNIYYKDLNRFRLEWNKSLETGEQLSHQVRLKRFDGQHRWFHIRFLPLKDKYGLTKYWHGQAMDIHELHEAEAKAAKSKEKATSEAKYRAIANSLPVVIFAASVPAGMTFANTQWLSYSGQTHDEALGFGFLEHIHPDDLVKCRFPGVGSQKPVFGTEPKGGILVRSGSSVSSAGGESEALSETERTVKASPITQDPADIIPNELLRGLANDGIIICAKDELGNLSITTEMRLKNRKGEFRWHLVQGSFIESVNFGSGDAQWFIACTDISNQKQNEAKIQDANSALETANLTLENEMRRRMGYLSSMSHEIRTPLNGIIGNLQFLINSGLNETNSEWAHSAQESAKNMHDLINDILDLSKAEANMLQLSFAWFNPREIMEQVLDMLCSKASEKKIEFTCECSEEVPKMIRGDPGRIRQVLLNLAGNSIKFTSQGEVVVHCMLMPSVPASETLPDLGANEIFIKWSVTDTGSGFTEEEKKLLFKPYSQIKNKNTRDSGGTGLGLILCRTMVTLHGGLIDASSKPGRGTEFTFFARFKARKYSVASLRSGMTSPVSGSLVTRTLSATDDHLAEPSAHRTSTSLDAARESPAMISDSSSVRSFGSTAHRTSVRSSTSTIDSTASMSLSLPSPSSDAVVQEQKNSSRKVTIVTDRSNIARSNAASKGTLATIVSQGSKPDQAFTNGTILAETPLVKSKQSSDLERSRFRPPMLSVLVVCPADQTRRITCDQVRYVVPQSAPCNITSEARIEDAELLMYGSDPLTFTHVLFRLSSDEQLANAIKRVLASDMHTQTCIVALTDQSQIKAIHKSLSYVDFDEMSKQDRLKMILKPAHVYKLAKVLDPFNENLMNINDPKEAKRNEEKRLQKESYALFKKNLGNKGMRVLAVEDNSVQMNILCNFLQKICHLDVVQAWNGQECLNYYMKYGPGYFSVIVTDIEMPILDGLTMCRRIRQWEKEHHWPPANVVSLSANTFYEGWTQSSAAGFTHYCPKPVNFRDLGHVLLELTNPETPHKFLKDRETPRAMLKKLGLLPPEVGNIEGSDDESDDGAG